MTSISASVGFHGRNKKPDVEVVQELLNRVPPPHRRPEPILSVDGLSGPKTIKAIQDFQVHHFGIKGADRRVDPRRQTIAKLNELQPKQPIPPAVRPVRKKGLRFSFQQPGQVGTALEDKSADYFFKVTDIRNNLQRLFYFGPKNRYKHITDRPEFRTGGRVPLSIVFVAPPGHAIEDFHTQNALFVTRDVDAKKGKQESTLTLLCDHEGRRQRHRVRILRHFQEPPKDRRSGTTMFVMGEFQLVENPRRWVSDLQG